MEELLSRVFPGRSSQQLKEAVQKGIGDADAEAREEARRWVVCFLMVDINEPPNCAPQHLQRRFIFA